MVDDAIVVIENIQRHMSQEHSDSHAAASVAMSEVTGAVVATSLVLVAVFVPVAFFPGTTGLLYKQFSPDHRVFHCDLGVQLADLHALAVGPAAAAREAGARISSSAACSMSSIAPLPITSWARRRP